MNEEVTTEADPRQQFAKLLDDHRKIVFKVANTYARDVDDRADLAQEIAMQLWRAFPTYDSRRTFSTWMYRIALNVAISFLRGDSSRRAFAVPLDDDVDDVADDNVADHDANGQVRAFRRFIALLKPLNRALMLLYLEDRSSREIAEVLGISESNVGTKINRLKQRFRQDMTGTNDNGIPHGTR
ncbi:MAG: RNA polymerase sigma factor [Pseudoxanthomonas sp.]